MMNGPRLVVVGAGIAGLAAALRLRDRLADADVVVVDGGDRLGGKLRTGWLAGGPVETGAEMFLAREAGGESAAVALARRVGLGGDLAHPAAEPSGIAWAGVLRPLPAGTLFGIPSDVSALDGLAAPAAGLDVDTGRPVLASGEDVSVGSLVRARLGDEVVDRLVDPMVGGVYAGRADRLSLAATMPGLHAAAQREPTLIAAVRSALGASPRAPGTPVFATVAGGLSRLVDAVAAASGARVRLGAPVRELARTPAGWRVVVGSTRAPETIEADGLVLAVPGRPAARLLAGVDGAAAAAVRVLDYASVALVTLALPAGTGLPPGSGFLVPAQTGHAIKAATFFTNKWPHLRRPDGPVLVRVSLGRYGEEALLRHTDAGLIDLAVTDLRSLLGGRLPDPDEVMVTRWGGALPQYGVGHVDRVARVRASLPGTLALAGAAYDGVGIAACVRSGEAAAAALAAALAGWDVREDEKHE